jgi:SAM-dependent methyltransferase
MPQLEEAQLRAAYSNLYYPDAEGCHAAHYQDTPESVLRQVLCQIDAKFGPLIGTETLDYGCGRGALSHAAIECGARPVGVEPNPNARNTARQTSPFPIYESLEALQTGRGDSPFDFIFLWEVIEHLREPWRELAELRKLLKPGGRIVISTPNANGLNARLLRSRWDNYMNPTHFYYFAPASLRLALGTAGFEEIAQLHFAIHYPHHGAVRSAIHRVLVRHRLDGELLFTAGLGASEVLTHGNCIE